jgi:23S rRNA-/tRNA-specific pseudouridylate synthase
MGFRNRYPEELTVAEWLAARGDDRAARFRPCHTLDYATSGLLVVSKTPEALATMSLAFDHTSR